MNLNHSEKVFLILVLAGLAGIAYAHRRAPVTAASNDAPPAAVPVSDIPSNDVGPKYMTYNAPWNFAPPVGNMLPPIVAGQVGQTVINPSTIQTPAVASDNCGVCGS